MNDGRAIANFILDNFDADDNGISNKKINKLIYFAHGFSLLRLRVPLVRNHIEAWKHGPVVRVVYDAFKQFEFRPISLRATYFSYASDCEEVVPYEDLSSEHRKLTRIVTAHFVRFSADELEDMTHSLYGPWAKIWSQTEGDRGMRSRIPDADISAFFEEKYGENPKPH